MISQNVKDAVKTAIVNIIEDVITNDIEEEQRQKKRVRHETPTYWDSTWGPMFLDPTLADFDSFAAKKFRRRFRVPYPFGVEGPFCLAYSWYRLLLRFYI